VIALMAALALALIFLVSIVWALLGIVGMLLIYFLAVGPLAFSNGLIINLIYPPVAVILAAIVGYAYRYLTELKQKTKTANALTTFVNSDVTARVLEGDEGVEKSAVRKEISVIFTDIKSFTTISESLQPQSVVALLNEYFEVMAGVVLANGGTVDKYEGDALMAYFEGENHAVRAAKTALGMRTELPKLLDKWRNDPPLPGGEKKPEIDFRVGVSTGDAVMGNMGSSRHIQYTVIGDTVNLGSRLEGANKKFHTHIMVAEKTYEAINNEFICRFLMTIEVVGKAESGNVYELICPREELTDDQKALLIAYNKGLGIFGEHRYEEAANYFDQEVLTKWPNDYMSSAYAARARKFMKIPPKEGEEFLFIMETK